MTWIHVPNVQFHICLFQALHNDTRLCVLSVSGGQVSVVCSGRTFTQPFDPRRTWNHVAVSIAKGKMALFINGVESAKTKLTLPQTCRVVVGYTKEMHVVPAAVFKLGPLHLLDVALTDVAVRQIFLLGPTYRGAFQSSSYAAYDTIRPSDPPTVQVARSISETLRVSPGDFAFAIPERAVTLSLTSLRDITHPAVPLGVVNDATPADIVDGTCDPGGVALLLSFVLKADTQASSTLRSSSSSACFPARPGSPRRCACATVSTSSTSSTGRRCLSRRRRSFRAFDRPRPSR